VNLRLLVALSHGDQVHSPETLSNFEEWALDNGFEFIDIGRDNVTHGTPVATTSSTVY
jgi:hypothetical protein